jgi:hypothetical protein
MEQFAGFQWIIFNENCVTVRYSENSIKKFPALWKTVLLNYYSGSSKVVCDREKFIINLEYVEYILCVKKLWKIMTRPRVVFASAHLDFDFESSIDIGDLYSDKIYAVIKHERELRVLTAHGQYRFNSGDLICPKAKGMLYARTGDWEFVVQNPQDLKFEEDYVVIRDYRFCLV